LEPSPDFEVEESWLGILSAAQLLVETVLGGERNGYRWPVNRPTLPHQPDAEIKSSGGVGQHRDHFSLDGNAVLVDLAVEGFTQGNQIVEVFGEQGLMWFGGVEPELHAIEELKARQVDDCPALWLLFGAEEDAGREDALKPSTMRR
jgi:hypothetical protein